MKLEHFFEALSHRKYSKEEIAQAVRDIKSEPEFKEIEALGASYKPGSVTEAHGTLMFQLPDGKKYGVYQEGSVRTYSTYRPSRMISPFGKLQPKRLIDAYKDRLRKLKVIIERYLVSKEKVREFGFSYKIADGVPEGEATEVLEDLKELFKFSGTVTVYPGKVVSFTGKITPTGHFTLDKLPFTLKGEDVQLTSWVDGRDGIILKSLEGLPKKLNRLSLDYPPESWNHLPKFAGKYPRLELKIKKDTPLLGLMIALQKNGPPFPQVRFRDPNLIYLSQSKHIKAVEGVFNQNLPHGRPGILAVQKELIDQDMVDNAKI